MSNVHIRGLEKELIQKLKQNAAEQNTSVNTLVLTILRQQLGLLPTRKVTQYHDLDKLAGTWTAVDAKEFTKNIQSFEVIDKDIWK